MSIYGLLIGIGVVIIIEYLNRKKFLSIKESLILIISTLFFSRLIFIFHNISEISKGEINPIAIWDGGLTIHGAILGILVGVSVILMMRSTKRPEYWSEYFHITDNIFILLPLAQAIGRWGNFFNNELYGKPTHSLFGIFIPLERRLEGYESFEYFHPTFLYESILNILNFLILLILKKKYKDIKTGTLTAIYFINYGIIRIFMNMLRIDKEYLFGIETSDIYSILLILFGLVILNRLWIKKRDCL